MSEIDRKSSEEIESGDRDLFLELLAMHESQLLGLLTALVRNYSDAEDLFQQTVLTMWQKFGDFEKGTNFLAWACRIARNHAMNLISRRKEVALSEEIIDLLTATQMDEEPALRQDRRVALASCIKKLPTKDQELVRSAYRGKVSINDIASSRGRSRASIYNSLSRIRSALFRCIESTMALGGN